MSGERLKRYREATVWLADKVEALVVDGRLDFPEFSFADALAAWSPGCDRAHNAFGSFSLTSYMITEEAGIRITQNVKSDPDFFDAAAKICATNIIASAPLPGALKLFAYQVLTGEVKRPKKPHRPRKKNWLELSYIYSISREASRKFKLSLTRNDDGTNKHSACDALAEALAVCGRPTAYTEIKNLHVHRDYAAFRREQVQAALSYRQQQNRKQIVEALLLKQAKDRGPVNALTQLASFGGLGGLGGLLQGGGLAVPPTEAILPGSGLAALGIEAISDEPCDRPTDHQKTPANRRAERGPHEAE